MKLRLGFIIAFGFLNLFSCQFMTQNLDGYNQMIQELVLDSVPYMDVIELSQNETQEIYILDTREKSEFKVSHIPNAIHVGYLFFSKKSVKNIPKDAVIVTYCSVGYRSGKLGERLMRSGFTNVYNLKGGIFSWANMNLPMEDINNKPTIKVHGYNNKWSQWLNPKNCEITY